MTNRENKNYGFQYPKYVFWGAIQYLEDARDRSMCANAGHKVSNSELTSETIYKAILAGNEALDDAEVPETGRVLVVTPSVYSMMKFNSMTTLDGEAGSDMRKRGVIGMLDGCSVVRVPAKRLPENFAFMIAHPSATVAPVKLAEFNVHLTPPGVSGNLIEGRIVYDAFVLENKAKGIYYHSFTESAST